MCPQHLQQQELFYEHHIDSRLRASSPLPWGIIDVAIDPAALAGGHVRVTQFEGVLPEGLALSIGPRGQGAVDRPLDDHFAATAESLDVYLAVPRAGEGSSNYRESDTPDRRARFTVSDRETADLAEASSHYTVQFGEPNATLLFGNEPRDDYETIKIAEIVREDNGAYALSSRFVPPIVRISTSEFLIVQSKALLAVVLGKQRKLASARNIRSEVSVEFSPDDTTRFLLLHALNEAIPLLRHCIDTTYESPLVLYRILLTLAAKLTTFSTRVSPEELPPFLFVDQSTTFHQLFFQLERLLDVGRDRFVPMPVELRARDEQWIGQPVDERLKSCRAFVFAIQSNRTEDEMSDDVPGHAKIASFTRIPQIVRAALPGVPLRLLRRPPPEIPMRPHEVYFAIDTGHEYWAEIMNEQTIAVVLPRAAYDRKKTKISIMGILS